MRRSIVMPLVGVLGLTAFAMPSQADETQGDIRPTRVRVTEQGLASPVSEQIVGANHRWPRGGLGMWDEEKDRPHPHMVELARRAGLKLVRYPGGTVANLFDFRKAIGPQSQRECQVGGGFVGRREPKDSAYGPDEHMEFVEAIGAEANIMVSSVLSTEHAADFVEYMNTPVGENPNGGTAWAEVRAANGHREPYGIDAWEIGNEIYLNGQRYWRSEDYQTRLRQYAFGGTQRQIDQPLGTKCDQRPEAGVSDGSAHQAFKVHFPPVAPDTQTVYVDGTTWREVEDLDSAGPNEKVYTFDPASGWLRFGDGVHGAIPPQDAQLTADYTAAPHPGFVDYYAAMKEVDPSIDICSTWGRTEFVELMGTEHPYDCLAPHLYGRPDVSVPPDEVYATLMTMAPDVIGEIEALEPAIAEYAPADDPPYIAVTEYGHIAAPRTGPGPEGWRGSLTSSMYFADLVVGMIEHGVAFAESSNLNHRTRTVGELFAGPPFIYTARAQVHELAGRLAGSRPVVTELEDNPEASGEGDYRALRMVSTRTEDGTVRLYVINRDRNRDVRTSIHLHGSTGIADLEARTVNSADVMDYNTYDDTSLVTTTTSRRTVAASNFLHTFPAHSVSLLEIRP